MKKFTLSLAVVVGGLLLNAQVGIGTSSPDSETLLDLKTADNNKAVGLPTVSLESLTDNGRNPIENPKEGFFVYNTNELLTDGGVNYGKGLYFHDGIQWNPIQFVNFAALTEGSVTDLFLNDADPSLYPLALVDYTETRDNIGGEAGSLDPVTGIFTAPSTGVYEMTMTGNNILALSDATLTILKNGDVVNSYAITGSVQRQSLSTTFSLDLDNGDEISLEITPDQLNLFPTQSINFGELKVQYNSQPQ